MKLTLPSGKRVELTLEAPKPQRRDILFAEGLGLTIAPGNVRDLSLADFHVVRAVATKKGLLPEEEIEIECLNCAEPIAVKPCALLETGPWEDGEVSDPELDRLVPDERFEPRTVREAIPLWKALARRRFDIDDGVVKAMGLRGISAETLASCDDATFEEITDAWLDAWYVPRLAAEVFCPKCKARNTVDAPYEREFERGLIREGGASSSESGKSGESRTPLAPLEDFVDLAHAIAEPLLAEVPEPPELIVEDGTPAVDDGGVPLLGSYVPPPPKDAPVPARPGTITVYYRTFQAAHRDEPDFDWEDELRETIEHELEHHVYFLRGDDPMDEEERAEIAAEAVRVVGKREAARRELAGFGSSLRDFFRRAWPLVLIAAVVFAVTVLEARCSL
ncbi:MAG: metallopeptidase family protein [Labilithrix sp.]|nr:metallopeptidase family protein [Labilithrix sp.]MCW5811744.1 metallopeptidase family protein [Labilithrix sp.]